MDSGTKALIIVRDHPLRLLQHPFLFDQISILHQYETTDHMSDISDVKPWIKEDRKGVGSRNAPRF